MNAQGRLRFRDLANLAGALTLARLPLAFITAFTMHDRRLFFGVFALAMLTDVLDGPVARWTKKSSRAGAVADGWADKIFLINYAWTMQMAGLIEGWHMWVWFLRELLQGAWVPLVALDYANRRKPFPTPTRIGKFGTVCIALAIGAAFLDWTMVRDVLTWAGGLSGLAAAGIYFRRDRPWDRFTERDSTQGP